jgi:hypothetical protein
MGQLRLLCVALSLVAGAAGAQKVDKATVEATRKHYEEAVKAYDLGEFAKAVEQYKAAYNLKQDPVFLYNIAQAYRLAKNLEQAVFFYRSYLRKLPAASNRAEVEARIQELENVMTPNPKSTNTGTTSPTTKEPEPAPDPARVEHPETTTTTPAPTAATSAPTSDAPRPKPKLWIVGVVVAAVALVAGAVILGVVLGTTSSTPMAPVSHFGPVTVAF